MNFDDFDRRMRVYETVADYCVLPEIYMVARLDGRGFTRLTKEVCRFEAPFDVRFRDLMVETSAALMNCGFKVVYAFTESDEISLLFDPGERLFGRKLRKYQSTLAGEASARFSLLLGRVATFDCRISQLPTRQLVVDYFRWRAEDAARNALNAWCYWTDRQHGLDRQTATAALRGLSRSQKHERLFARGINFNDLPAWQKRGVGLYWQMYEKQGVNRQTGEIKTAVRRRLQREFELPVGDEYSGFVANIAFERVLTIR